MKLAIIIPAHNEEHRIGATLKAYGTFLRTVAPGSRILVAMNACSDNTLGVVQQMQQLYPEISYIHLDEGGKGYAVKEGFKEALTYDCEYIGFVDADMATSPQEFYKLAQVMPMYDGVIASRYMPGAVVTPPRPWIKRWGSKIFYESLVKLLFGIYYYDYQCGAKLFTKHVVATIVPYMHVRQWAFDVELLYLCKRFNFKIKEIPTEWHDQSDSKLQIMRSGLKMLTSVIALRLYYSPFKKYMQ